MFDHSVCKAASSPSTYMATAWLATIFVVKLFPLGKGSFFLSMTSLIDVTFLPGNILPKSNEKTVSISKRLKQMTTYLPLLKTPPQTSR